MITTERTPYELLHGYTPKLINGVIQQFGLNSATCQDPRAAQQEARDRICEKQRDMAKYYSHKHVDNVVFDTGEVVAMSTPPVAGEASKLQVKYRGPLQVLKVLPNDTYRVASVPRDGGCIFSTTAHVSQLKQWRLVEDKGDIEEETSSTSPSSDDEPAHMDNSIGEGTDTLCGGVTEDIPNRRREKRRPAYLDDYVE